MNDLPPLPGQLENLMPRMPITPAEKAAIDIKYLAKTLQERDKSVLVLLKNEELFAECINEHVQFVSTLELFKTGQSYSRKQAVIHCGLSDADKYELQFILDKTPCYMVEVFL